MATTWPKSTQVDSRRLGFLAKSTQGAWGLGQVDSSRLESTCPHGILTVPWVAVNSAYGVPCIAFQNPESKRTLPLPINFQTSPFSNNHQPITMSDDTPIVVVNLEEDEVEEEEEEEEEEQSEQAEARARSQPASSTAGSGNKVKSKVWDHVDEFFCDIRGKTLYQCIVPVRLRSQFQAIRFRRSAPG